MIKYNRYTIRSKVWLVIYESRHKSGNQH